MAAARRAPGRRAVASKSPGRPTAANAVDAFMAGLRHPLVPELQAVRAAIRGASPRIREGIKWNAPSFRTGEWFATASIRKDKLLVILHRGAKVKDDSSGGLAIDDPGGLLRWLAKERAMIEFEDGRAIAAGRAALQRIVRQWIAGLPDGGG